MDDAAWGALTLALTVLGGIYTWFAFRNRGWVPALRGVGLTAIPVALWLTDTLQLLGDVGGAVGDWAVDFVFSPAAWLGIILAVVSVACFVAAGFLQERGLGTRAGGKGEKPARQGLPEATGAGREPVLADVDPEMAEIEALLRKRGIS